MGHDNETDETYFTTELLVDGCNSGMFINRDLFPVLKRFIKEINDQDQLRAYLNTIIRQMVSTALLEVESDVIAEFLANEIKQAK